MTQEQKTELNYLLDIVMEASKFKIEDGQDAIRLEVESRIENILNSAEDDGETEVQGEPEVSPVLTEDDYKALESAKVNDHLASPEKVDDARRRWESKKVRVFIDGKHVWKPRAQCVRQPRDNSKGGAAWKWKFVGPQDKQGQCDAMWADHEAGNAE